MKEGQVYRNPKLFEEWEDKEPKKNRNMRG